MSPDPARLSRRYVALVVNAVTLVLLISAVAMVPVPFVTFKPGPAFNTLGEFDGQPLFTFGAGVKTYPTSGSLDFTTVRVSEPGYHLSTFELLLSYADRNTAVLPYDVVYKPDETNEQSQQESAALMSSSQDASTVTALRAAGYQVTEDVVVRSVSEGGAADGVLRDGDVIRAVDGKRAAASSDVVDAVSSVEPGTTVTLVVERDGRDRRFDIRTKAGDDDPDRALIGVTLGPSFDYPIKVDNNVGDQVGGPSAGLMFALGIYDKLTPNDLTGGLDVAGTGTIDIDGKVGPIGGIAQKIAGAEAAGATVFLAPADNCDEVVGHERGLTVVKVDTFDDAVSGLQELAKDPDAKVPTCDS